MANLTIDLLTGKEFLFNKGVGGSSTGGTTQTVWGDIDGDILNQTDLSNELSKLNNELIKYRTENTSIILTSADNKSVIRYTSATNITVTVPNTLLMYSEVVIIQGGAGVVTLVGDTNVILNSATGLNTNGQYNRIYINKVDENLFDVLGGVV